MTKQKSAVMKHTTNPAWEHLFVYKNLPLVELSERCLEMTVWDQEYLTTNEFLGGVRLNNGYGFARERENV